MNVCQSLNISIGCFFTYGVTAKVHLCGERRRGLSSNDIGFKIS